MIDPWTWMEQLRQRLQTAFLGRVWFLGLQGSFGRGEAREGSDIDPVVILDRLTAADTETYRALLDTLPHRAGLRLPGRAPGAGALAPR